MMSTYSVLRIVVVLLVLLPLIAAVVVPLFGRVARSVSLLIALVHLGMTVAVITIALPTFFYHDDLSLVTPGQLAIQRFYPHFVPGDTAENEQFGADARTNWTLLKLSATEGKPNKPGPRIQFFIGIDGLNLWLVALTSFIFIPVILMSWNAVSEKPGSFFGWLFLLQGGLIGTFLAFDVILFYVFFELTLIPAFFLIGHWGIGSGRRDAARKFFLYTLAGSLLTLVGVIGIVLTNPTPLHPITGTRESNGVVAYDTHHEAVTTEWTFARAGPITFALPDLMHNVQVWSNVKASAQQIVLNSEMHLRQVMADEDATPDEKKTALRQLESAKEQLVRAEDYRSRYLQTQFWLFIALLAGFMVKVPVWPFHTWLPAAYGAAPIGVVMLLSAVMAKLGTFGILRLVLPLTPDAAIQYGLPVIGVLAAIGIVYAAFCAFASKDMKMLVAYSSISHLGLLVLGLLAFNREGLSGAVLHMINHGLTTAALFALLGFLFARYRTTEIARYSGLMGRFPVFAFFAFVLFLASVGLPGLNNFVSEMLIMAGLFAADNPGVNGLWPAIIAAIGIFLSAWYTLTLLRAVFFNTVKEPPPVEVSPPRDVTRHEFYALGLIAACCLFLGLWPQPVVESMKADVRILAEIGDAARARIRDVPYSSKEVLPRPAP